MRQEFKALYGPYLKGLVRVNVGCARNHEPGWINVDLNPAVKPDIIAALPNLPFDDDSVDTILASHVLEHVEPIFETFAEFWRVLVPGGYLVCVTPHGNSDISWNDPLHIRRFDEQTWWYFTPTMCYEEDTAGYGADQCKPLRAWQIVTINSVPVREFASLKPEELEKLARHQRNILREVHCVMRKPW